MDGQWYGYDDSSVELVPEEEISTRGAYILFYQRRNTIPPWSASCSVRGEASLRILGTIGLTADPVNNCLLSL